MTTLNQNAVNDIFVDGTTGDFSVAADKYAHAIILRDCIRTVLGELQYDTEKGVPYFDTVFAHPSFIGKWKTDVRGIVSSFDFVRRIISFDVDFRPEEHILNYTLTIETDEGTETIQG